MGVVPQPRIAWEGARVFVTAASVDAYWWLSGMIAESLGVAYATKLADTRRRLQAEDVSFAETGCWRVRLEELLHSRPDLAPLVLRLVAETTARLSR
jgi:hypothetical protein